MMNRWQILIIELRDHHPDAYVKLKAKAAWEQMTLVAVLREWGDPRAWN